MASKKKGLLKFMFSYNHNGSIACALVAPATKGSGLSIKKFSDLKSLVEEFGQESAAYPLVSMSKVLFLNNVSNIYCIAPSINSKPSKQNYIDAFKILQGVSGFYCIACDSNEKDIISELTKSIDNINRPSQPRFAFACLGPDLDKAIDLSKSIGHPKLTLALSQTCLTSNPSFSSSCLTAAALAAAVASISKPLENLNGVPIFGLSLNQQPLNKATLNKLVNCGISSLRYLRGQLETYKIVPSKTLASNISLNMSSPLILDFISLSIIDLINNIKTSPSFKFLSCSSLTSQIILLLSEIKDLELISDFEKPKINISSSINISISVKPESLFDDCYISSNISI